MLEEVVVITKLALRVQPTPGVIQVDVPAGIESAELAGPQSFEHRADVGGALSRARSGDGHLASLSFGTGARGIPEPISMLTAFADTRRAAGQ
jgi:hypothetical protein